ncbi:MAG: type IV secretion protein Rhs [Bacteroidetes bacterium]|nr:type IV secretion protein Rhs [Bacteroidota bacterium]
MTFRYFLFLVVFPFALWSQSNDKNWVKKTIYKQPTTSPDTSDDPLNVATSVTYFDDFGRPVQQVAHKESENNDKDIVSYTQYNDFGKPVLKSLPFTATQDMGFMDDPSALLSQFQGYDEPERYSEFIYNESPFGLVNKMSSPGTHWKMGSEHEVKVKGNMNLSCEITDENGNTTFITKDMKGLIHEKSANYGFEKARTVYEYDDSDNLKMVKPPKYFTSSQNENAEDNLCYKYEYDYKNRLIKKKQPEKQWEYIVYDALDRIVATGPVNNPFGGTDSDMGWLYNRYDNLNRIVLTGWFSDNFVANSDNSNIRDNLQNQYNNGVTNSTKMASGTNTVDGFNIQYTIDDLPQNLILLTVNYYDNYAYPDAPTSFTTPLSNNAVYFNNINKPQGLLTSSWVRVLTDPSDPIKMNSSYLLYDYRGRAVATYKNNYLGGYTNTFSELGFDGKVKSVTTNHKNATLVLSTKNNFEYTNHGRVSRITHEITYGDNTNVKHLVNYNYDELGKLIQKITYDGPNAGESQVIDYKYNIRGWLTQINDVNQLTVGNNPMDLFAFKINYDNIEGNVPNTTAQYNGNISETYWRTATDNTLRKYSYRYDELNRMLDAVYQKPELTSPIRNSYNESVEYDINGNITRIKRNGYVDAFGVTIPTDDLIYTYKTDSDKLIGVVDATNNLIGFRDSAASNLIDYSYDAHGNQIQDLNKKIPSKGIKYNHLNLPTEIAFAQPGGMPTIKYIYDALGDKTEKIITSGATIKRTLYIDGFQYLNDDLQFFPSPEGYVAANKVNGDYKFNYAFQYKDHLGNIRLTYGLDPDPQVNQVKILEENHYYPFGLKHDAYNSTVKAYKPDEQQNEIELETPVGQLGLETEKTNKYKFNGQEWQDELGLNLYDMDMRDYDPAIGRWTGIDPVTHFNQSPYCAMDNNPVSLADPSGADGIGGGGVGGEHFTSVFGMQISTPTSTGMYTGVTDSGMPIPFGTNVGAAWGDGGLLGTTYTGKEAQAIYASMFGYERVKTQWAGRHGVANGSDLGEVEINFKWSWEKTSEGSWGNALNFGEVAIAFKQIRMTNIRESMPIMNKIGNFSKFASEYGAWGKTGRVLGPINNAIGAYNLSVDYNDSQVSSTLFSYRATGFAASIGTTAAVSSYLGGPMGTICGAIVGLGFEAGEIANQLWNQSIYSISTFSVNFNGYVR